MNGVLLFAGVSHAVQVIPHNGDATIEALARKTLAHDHGRDLGVDLQQPGDLVFEGIELLGGYRWLVAGWDRRGICARSVG